jgi:uncharacterized protein (DUF1800 family)
MTSMAVNTSLESLDPRLFGYVEARHLLNRAGFGGTPQQVQALVDMGLQGAVDHLVDFHKVEPDAPAERFDPDIMRPETAEERAQFRMARSEGNEEAFRERMRLIRAQRDNEDREQFERLGRWWLARMISTPRPLEEKLTLLWHSHFACNYRGVRDSYMLYQQNEFFRANAGGSFEALARGIIRDPAMLRFLNNDQNRRQKPNENLARELMELFTLGEGNYTEQDIKQGARALTGYTIEDHSFKYDTRNHDTGAKSILDQQGEFDGDDFVGILLRQKACSRFIARKLYRHFVADLDAEPDNLTGQVLEKLADAFVKQKYHIGGTLKVLFKSRHFYDEAVMGNQVKSPAQLVAGSVRALGTPVRDMAILAGAMGVMGQKLFDPPSVAGWSGGQSWINTSTLLVRQNLCVYLLTGKLPYDNGWNREQIGYDPAVLVSESQMQSRGPLVDKLLLTLIGPRVAPARRAQLMDFLAARPDPIKSDTVLGLLLLVTAMPEYQLC